MSITISKNIRYFRKSISMTQEQLAERLEISTGAVSKWERGAAMPELHHIIAMAELFGISTDALIGYAQSPKPLANKIADSILKLLQQRNYAEAIEAAEAGLRAYPNEFAVNYQSARAYLLQASTIHQQCSAERAAELFERCCGLYSPQCKSIASLRELHQGLSNAYRLAGRAKDAIELLKAHNENGMHDSDIGASYVVDFADAEAAFPFLGAALDRSLREIINIVTGYCQAYEIKKEYERFDRSLEWLISLLTGLKEDADGIIYYERLAVIFEVYRAYAKVKLSRCDEARSHLRTAIRKARHFDQAPVYTLEGIFFRGGIDTVGVYHDFSASGAFETVKALCLECAEDDGLMLTLWEEIIKEE